MQLLVPRNPSWRLAELPALESAQAPAVTQEQQDSHSALLGREPARASLLLLSHCCLDWPSTHGPQTHTHPLETACDRKRTSRYASLPPEGLKKEGMTVIPAFPPPPDPPSMSHQGSFAFDHL